jgi:hypothetical protein
VEADGTVGAATETYVSRRVTGREGLASVAGYA